MTAKLWLEGAQVQTKIFDPDKPYCFCNLCGDIFQDITINEPKNTELRRSWSISHSLKHSQQEHKNYVNSGLKFLPEAQIKLAAFGIIEINNNDETRQALRESKPILDGLKGKGRSKGK
jgi:hypothetical protein